jgi:multisubunit Na+/H+ antiporter MnhG subunit
VVDEHITRPKIVTTITLLAIALLLVGPFTSFSIQQATAESNGGNDHKSCSADHSGDGNCSHNNKDSTPFLLPFP